MESSNASRVPDGKIATFLRRKDYRVLCELGQGACGKTVLLQDEQIGEQFVCKKYHPYTESKRVELYNAFVREIKLLHRLYHKNVVRVFNFYLYPDSFTGYILMEHIDGSEIDTCMEKSPEKFNECFVQAISGFAYLEACGILHRDIRARNLMVNRDGVLKIIDLGFGKRVEVPEDFQKSITLNWHCSAPAEFKESKYDFVTEIYFLGKLFESLRTANGIVDFKYPDLLKRMCSHERAERPASFSAIETEIGSGVFSELEFDDYDLLAYRRFATAIFRLLSKIDQDARYVTDPDRVLQKLSEVLRTVSLEETVPTPSIVLNCIVNGAFYYIKKQTMEVPVLRQFVELLSRCSLAQRRVILANLHAKLDSIDRYSQKAIDVTDIPF